jgi:tricarballylate dehydrogenase
LQLTVLPLWFAPRNRESQSKGIEQTMTTQAKFDVVVVGAGNAAFSAALTAQQAGASVLVLEKAPEHARGGNTYFTGGAYRFAYNGFDEIHALVPDLSEGEAASMVVGSYTTADFRADLMRVTEGLSDEDLADTLVRQSYSTMEWLRDQGMRFIPLWTRQAFKEDGKFRFWGGLILEAVGAGKGLSDRFFELAAERGIEVRYASAASGLLLDSSGRVIGVTVRGPDGFYDVPAGSVVLACGGFEANAEMRTRYLGAGWELAKVRGVQTNTGDGIRMALDAGAQPFGHWSGAHAVAWDLNAPPFGNRAVGDLYQKHSYPFGLIVNAEGKRFVDEGADLRNYTYAKYGREILAQPQRLAVQVFDQKSMHLLRDEYHIPQMTVAETDTIEQLGEALGIDAPALVETVATYNAACQPGDFDPTVLDGLHTAGLEPPKSNWARPIDTPPYVGYAVTCGITFTFGGLKIGRDGQVLDGQDIPMQGLYAAGELVGGLFYHNYPGGSGLMAGAVFGRIAGAGAAKSALGG